MTRDEFREQVFKRDNDKCVICGEMAKDAHHIIERRLFPDGGYYIDNGASLCEKHHIEAEQTILSCDEIRKSANINSICLPPHLYSDEKYDKWGNIIMPNGQRLKGELYNDESVQKILSNVLDQFSDYVKYPRTYHLSWSPGVTKDDRVQDDLSSFYDKRVIATVKMDGENTTMYKDYIHARSIDSKSHPSRSYVKNLHGKIRLDIPDGFRVCGENLYAKHSIHYNNLANYFMVYSIWNNKNECLSWDSTKEYVDLLGLTLVPVLYDGVWDRQRIHELYDANNRNEECEGYVVRLADSFTYGAFKKSVVKYVRASHVTTHGHWMRDNLVLNNLK